MWDLLKYRSAGDTSAVSRQPAHPWQSTGGAEAVGVHNELGLTHGEGWYVETNGVARDTHLSPGGFSPLYCPHVIRVCTCLRCLLRPQSTQLSQLPTLTYSLWTHPYLRNALPSPPCLVHANASSRTQVQGKFFPTLPSSLFFFSWSFALLFHSIYHMTFQHLLVQLFN